MIIWVLVFFSFSMPSSDILVMSTWKLPYQFSTYEQCRETEEIFHEQTPDLVSRCIDIKKPDFYL